MIDTNKVQDVRNFIVDGDRTSLMFAENLARNGRLIVALCFVMNLAGFWQTQGFLSGVHHLYAFGAWLAVASIGCAYLSDMFSRTMGGLATALAGLMIGLVTISMVIFLLTAVFN